MVQKTTERKIKIREYVSEDCPKLLKLFYNTVHTVNADDYTKEQLNAWAPTDEDQREWDASFHRHHTVVAEADSGIVGFADMDENGYLDRLYVHENYQQQGIGSALCDILETAYQGKELSVCSSITAKPFFEKRGYQLIETQDVVRQRIKIRNFRMIKWKKEARILKKKCLILMGSPRKNGNTIALVRPFKKKMENLGVDCRLIWLYEQDLRPCLACRACQKDWKRVYCAQEDDMQEIFDEILACDLLVLATPVYAWYCTAPMKAMLDRLAYAMNKYYGDEKGPALWQGKKVALISTCGYRPEQGTDLWETGIKRYCKHSKLTYMGMLAERHLGYKTVFMDSEKEKRAVAFADTLWEKIGKCAEKIEK